MRFKKKSFDKGTIFKEYFCEHNRKKPRYKIVGLRIKINFNNHIFSMTYV